MDKRWYPAAISAVVIGCGGSTFDGNGESTGGEGSSNTTSATGSAGNSSTTPATGGTGGFSTKTGIGGFAVAYGPIPVGGMTGGSTAATGGSRASIGGGSPVATGGNVTTKYGPLPVGGSNATSRLRRRNADSDGRRGHDLVRAIVARWDLVERRLEFNRHESRDGRHRHRIPNGWCRQPRWTVDSRLRRDTGWRLCSRPLVRPRINDSIGSGTRD